MRTAEKRRIRVLMLLAIAAGLAGLVAYYASPGKKASPGGRGKTDPDGRVDDDQRGHRPGSLRKAGGTSGSRPFRPLRDLLKQRPSSMDR